MFWNRKREEKYNDLYDKSKDLQCEVRKLKEALELEKEKYAIKISETLGLANLDKQQDIAKLKRFHEERIVELKTKFIEEKAALKSKLEEEFYKRTKEAIHEMNKDGTSQTKFVQDMALNLISKAPIPTSFKIENK